MLGQAEGNPLLPRGARPLARSRRARSSARHGGWRFDHDVSVEIPPTVEKLLLARIDRLTPACRDVLTAASALGRHVRAAAARRRARSRRRQDALHELQRLELVRETRRWPQPEYRFQARADPGGRLPHDPGASLDERCTGRRPSGSSSSTRRTSTRCSGCSRYHWLAAEDEDRRRRLPAAGGRQGSPGLRARRGDRPLPSAAAAARAPRPRAGDGARPVQARDRPAHVDALRRGERGVPAGPSSTGRRRSRRSSRPTSFRRRRPLLPDSSIRRRGDRVDRHPALHAAVRPARRGTGPSARSCPRSPSAGRSPTTASATSSTSARG